MAKYSYEDKEFGIVIINLRSGMSSTTARWKDGRLHLNAPIGSTRLWIADVIEKLRPKIRLMQTKRTLEYHVGQRIECFHYSVTIGTHSSNRNMFGYGGTGSELYVNIPDGIDISNHNVSKTISTALSRLMADRAEATLIPFARQVAKGLGVNVKSYIIGRGLRKLGHCTYEKEIQLSANIMFFPEELVRYIICHELSHLTHMDHSAQFHNLCNIYCEGRERALIRQLKEFNWPILR